MTDVLGAETNQELERGADGPSFFNTEADPSQAETEQLVTIIVEKLEADISLRCVPRFELGKGTYSVCEDPFRQTDTKSALFCWGDDKIVAFSPPSCDQVWDDATMRMATHEEKLKLISDVTNELTSSLKNELALTKAEEEALYISGKSDYVFCVKTKEGDNLVLTYPYRDTPAAQFYKKCCSQG